MTDRIQPHDHEERRHAIHPGRSIIVQAPAGSGKTDLLTRRFLKLLAMVQEPEEILAITFTRAATAEMRNRIIADLEAAAVTPVEREEDERLQLARAALGRSEERGWNLLHQPHRLAIETIDSLCLRIAQDQPLLSRLGGRMNPVDRAEPLYQEAARRTLQRFGGVNAELHAGIAMLLRLRDNNLAEAESLLADMLAKRDQWAHAFPLAGTIDWDEVRLKLEEPFRREVRRVLGEVHRLMRSEPDLIPELMELAQYACGNPEGRTIDIGLLAMLRDLPPVAEDMLRHWECVCHLLLSGSGDFKSQGWRKRFVVTEGFPPAKTGMSDAGERRRQKARMENVVQRFARVDGLLEAMCAVRHLPQPRYTEAQYESLVHFFKLLRYAIAELRVLFAEQNAVDFAEVGMAAIDVAEHGASGRALPISGGIRHLLVDEFQDTSRRQHRLIQALLTEWEPGDDRTCFVVGDPMQSIYMFRQAEVELFRHVWETGIETLDGVNIPMKTVCLATNFRSHAGLTEPLNEMFSHIFKTGARKSAAAVPFSASVAANEALPARSLYIHPKLFAADEETTEAHAKRAHEAEAEEMLKIVQQHLPRIEEARAAGREYTVAILVRVRDHANGIARRLREKQIPYRAVEMERLSQRQEFQDLMALTRALLHPMDRLAWLSVLRAPWCGLNLRDLHVLVGEDGREFRDRPVLALADERLSLLSADGRLRAASALYTLRRALAQRYERLSAPSLSAWVEDCWRQLGGPGVADATAQENIRVFLRKLDEVSLDGIEVLNGEFVRRLEHVFAEPDPSVSSRCGVQVMTIHKAKGLGFDVVIVPGLDRKARVDQHPLIRTLERTRPHGRDVEFLVAPIGSKEEGADRSSRWVSAQREMRFAEEHKRLFYVACTRARNELHLLGKATTRNGAVCAPDASSLLASAWPALAHAFEAERAKQEAEGAAVIPFPQGSGTRIEPGAGLEMAAVGEARKLTLRRVKAEALRTVPPESEGGMAEASLHAAQKRHAWAEGSRQTRVLGELIHGLLERLGSRLATGSFEVDDLRRTARAMARRYAVTGQRLEGLLDAAVNTVVGCANDPVARWILGARSAAQSEVAWSGWFDGELKTLRADRVFRGGTRPQEPGDECFWVIDYKTAEDPALVEIRREMYALQLRGYGEVLRRLHGAETALRLGVYYPRLQLLDWWEG